MGNAEDAKLKREAEHEERVQKVEDARLKRETEHQERVEQYEKEELDDSGETHTYNDTTSNDECTKLQNQIASLKEVIAEKKQFGQEVDDNLDNDQHDQHQHQHVPSVTFLQHILSLAI